MIVRTGIVAIVLSTSTLIACASSLVACASYPRPVDRLANAEASVRVAREIHAAGTPNGALYLKYSEESLADAKKRMESGDNKEADALLIRSSADAELAIAVAKEAAAREKAQESAEQLHKTQEQGR